MLVTELCYNMFNPSTLNLFNRKFLIVLGYFGKLCNAAERGISQESADRVNTQAIYRI